MSTSATTVAPSGRLSLVYTARNAGNAAARASRTALLLSLDRRRGRSDRALGTSALRRMRPRSRHKVRPSVTVPAATPPGRYFLLACLDAGKRVRERNERNNCTVSATAITVASPPNIVPAPGPIISSTDSTPPPAPSIGGTSPTSPANDNSPEVFGTAEGGSTVRVYSGDCGGALLATGTAAAFASPGLTVAVPDNSTTSLRATATDAAGNVSGCSAAVGYVEDSVCPGNVDALLYEVNPNITSSKDLVELKVTAGGRLTGLTLEQAATATDVLASLPNVCVAAGDFVVIHWNPGAGFSAESTAKNQHPNATFSENYDTAWDLAGGVTALAFNDRVLRLRSAGGQLLDAVAFTYPGNAPMANPAGFPGAVQATQAAGEWSPANCGGNPCDYTSMPTVEDISEPWNSAGTTATGQSIQRIDVNDGNDNTDWTTGAQSWGADTN